MPYPWNHGDVLTAADLNNAIANAGDGAGGAGPQGPQGPPGPPGDTNWQVGLVVGLGTHLTLAGGTLDGVPSPWQAGAVNSLGVGLSLISGVLGVTGTASSPPSGPAGGDLGGNYPNPLALKTNGVAFAASATTDTTNASNITSGTLSVNRFNGGSGASSLTFLRGDGSWAAPATGAAPIGPAGGDLGGNYPNPTVATLGGHAIVNSATVDATVASNITSGTLPAARLPTSGVTAGTYTMATITVDATGRVTVASSNTAGGVTSVATGPGLSGGPITSTGTIAANWQLGTITALGTSLQIAGTTLQLPTTGVTAGSYTSTNLTVDAYGRITAASNGTGGSGITSIVTGTGLTGGTITSTGTIAMGASGVTPGSYTNTNLTVDATGRITTASNGSGGVGGGTVTQINTGAGLTGGPVTTTGTISLANISASSLLGNSGTVSAAPGAVAIGAGLSLSTGGTLSATAGAGTVSQINTTGAGISASPATITSTGTLSVEWNAGTVSAVGANLAISSNTLAVSGLAASATTDTTNAANITSGTLAAARVPALSALSGAVTYGQMPAEVQSLPIGFPFIGKPAASAMINLPMAMAITVPGTLAGTVAYDATQATASAIFTLNKISGGTTTALGTITITTTSHTSCTLSGAGGSLAIGDVLQMVAPSTQDSTLADLGITVLCSRT